MILIDLKSTNLRRGVPVLGDVVGALVSLADQVEREHVWKVKKRPRKRQGQYYRSPMLMDPHPSQQHAGLQHAV